MAFDFSFKYYLFCLQADFHLKSRSMWAARQHIIRLKRPILQRSSFTCPGSCHWQICSCSLAKRRVELMEYSTSTHSFIHSTSIYWVPTMCQALSWGVGNRYSSEDRQGTCSHGAYILMYTLAYISIVRNIILSKLIKAPEWKQTFLPKLLKRNYITFKIVYWLITGKVTFYMLLKQIFYLSVKSTFIEYATWWDRRT